MAYRDDRSALESSRDDLRRELDELETEAEALREAIRAKARWAALLDDVRIASPCRAGWDEMKGDDRVRFCGECRKNVYDLSALSREEATRLIAERETSICVRLYRRADGTTLTADCAAGVRRKRVRLAILGAAGASVLAGGAMWSAVTVTMGKMPAPVHEVEMGEIPATPRVSYVRQPLPPSPAPGLVFQYRQEPLGSRPGLQWTLWADGRAERVVYGRSPPPDAPLTGDAKVAAQEILALSRELRAEGTGAVFEHADSAVSRSYELIGEGQREATDADRARLFDLAARLTFAAEHP